MRLEYCIITFALLAQAVQASESDIRAFGYASLRQAIVDSVLKALDDKEADAATDPGGLILLLSDIDTEPARELLVELSELYLGESQESALTYSVAKHGAKIKTSLERLASQRVQCSAVSDLAAAQRGKLCLDRVTRDRRLRKFVDLIKSGRIPDYVM